MKLPKLENQDRYIGLYVFDFGDHTAVGYTAEEIAELFESEKFKNGKAYKIHSVYPDGRMELKGVRSEIFQLEMAMLFYSTDRQTAQHNFKQLVAIAVKTAPPSRAKVHLAKYNEGKFAVTLIYPAEYNDELSRWLLDAQYKTHGAAEAGAEALQRYYDQKPQILERQQLFAKSSFENRTGAELLESVKMAVQR